MGDTPSTVNGTVQAVEKALQVAEYDGAVNLAYSALVVQFPWLAWPIISSLARLAIKAFADQLFIPLNRLVAFKIIDYQTQAEASAFGKAMDALRQAQDALNAAQADKGTQDAHKQALDAARVALARLIHFDGA